MAYDNAGGNECRHLGGKPIDWKNPPKATERCQWTKRSIYGKVVTGSFRHICHLNRMNNLAVGKRGWKGGVDVIQPAYNTTVAASAGTHDKDMCVDLRISGVAWYTQQAFFRANGLGCWYRYPPSFPYHIHGFTLPVQVGTVRTDDYKDRGFVVGVYVDGGASTGGLRASSQLDDYYRHALGLSGQHTTGCDRSWFPASINATIFDLPAYIKTRAKAM